MAAERAMALSEPVVEETAAPRYRGRFGVAPANASFQAHMAAYAAVHGADALARLLGGMAAWGRAAARLRHAGSAAELRPAVELCALYWHFLLVVWLALFGLLLADNGGADAVLQPLPHGMH